MLPFQRSSHKKKKRVCGKMPPRRLFSYCITACFALCLCSEGTGLLDPLQSCFSSTWNCYLQMQIFLISQEFIVMVSSKGLSLCPQEKLTYTIFQGILGVCQEFVCGDCPEEGHSRKGIYSWSCSWNLHLKLIGSCSLFWLLQEHDLIPTN